MVPENPVQATPLPPTPTGGPLADWPHRELYEKVFEAASALPGIFTSSIELRGIAATDLYSFNSALGNAIEQSVVDGLNSLRAVWDPGQEYQLYGFVRQPQAFPDVRLQQGSGRDADVLMGIELKGWFVLAKEGEPSFRYTVNPQACAPSDLLMVFPWMLSEVISGRPRLLNPFIVEARYAAELRNHYWRHMRGKLGVEAEIIDAAYQTPYPRKGQKFNDKAKADSGGNFGRVSRGGVMDNFIKALMQELVAGVPLWAWQRFIAVASTSGDPKIERMLGTLSKEMENARSMADNTQGALARVVESVYELALASGALPRETKPIVTERRSRRSKQSAI